MEEIVILMTRCPNGCPRPFAEKIGLVGTALGKYNLNYPVIMIRLILWPGKCNIL
jgi:sulfite reductase beta subunit-like hemoprotein